MYEERFLFNGQRVEDKACPICGERVDKTILRNRTAKPRAKGDNHGASKRRMTTVIWGNQ
jgi:hypothetical protein